jgi:predicted RNase H-like HicB family nuclease
MTEQGTYTVRVHEEPGHPLWADVAELPGCFATGTNLNDLWRALAEAVGLYLSEPGHEVEVRIEDTPETVTEHHVLVHTA